MDLKLSTQTAVLCSKLGDEKAIAMFADAGYDALDYSCFHMSNDASPLNADNYREYAENLRRLADKNGIKFNQIHAPFTFKWADKNVWDNIAQPRVLRSLEVASIIGAEIAVVHPIHHTPYKDHEDEMFALNVDYYRSMIPYCREYGVKIGFENMWQREVKRKCISDDVGSKAAELAKYIDTIDSEYVVACLDVGHCSLVGEEAENAIRTLGHDRLKALHVHDNDYTGDQHTLPGLGKMNWNNIMAALRDIDYTGEFTYEADAFLRNFETDFLETAVKFMVQTGRYLIAKTNN